MDTQIQEDKPYILDLSLKSKPKCSSDSCEFCKGPESKPKLTRPFKAYPRYPLALAIGTANTNLTTEYLQYRRETLQKLNRAQNNALNKNMRRMNLLSKNNSNDPSYLEKRRKNNEAAKRSRDARRAKEDELAIRCAFLEQENMDLRVKLTILQAEKEKLQMLIFK